MPFPPLRARSGLVIIFAVAVLALMSVLGVSFILYSNLERNSGRNYVDGVRSLMLAESGVSRAVQAASALSSEELAALTLQFPAFPKDVAVDFHLGSGAPLLEASDVLGASYTPDGDVNYVRIRDTSGRINLNDTLGWDNIDTDLGPDTWDGGDPDAPNPDPGNPDSLRRCRIYRMLRQVLRSASGLGQDDGTADALALRVIERRLTGTFAGDDDVRGLMMAGNPALTAAQSEQLLDYVCLDSWQDPNVLKPTFTVQVRNPQTYAPDYPGGEIAEDGPASRVPVYRYQEFQTRHYEQEPRSPVNINRAPLAVIEALIADLQGWYLHEGPADTHTCVETPFVYFNNGGGDGDTLHFDYRDHDNPGFSNTYGIIRRTPEIPEDCARNIAAQLYKHIHGDDGEAPEYYNPFKSFQQFETWLRSASVFYRDPYEQEHGVSEQAPPFGEMPDWGLDPAWLWAAFEQEAGGTVFTQWDQQYGKRVIEDLILAAFNPNSMLNDFNPDYVRFYHVDKAQLIRHSTEISFEATGVFDIESEGRVYSAPTHCIARKTIRAKVKCFEMLRLTTQAQFLQGISVSNPLENYFNAYTGAGSTPFNTSLHAGPQPVLDPTPGEEGYEYMAGTFADGYIQPSVLNVAQELLGWRDEDEFQWFSPLCVDTASSLDAEVFMDSGFEFLAEVLPPVWQRYAYDTASDYDQGRNACFPGNLTSEHQGALELPVRYIDGAFSEAGRTLAYPIINLFTSFGKRAVFSFWFKPCFDTGAAMRPRKLLSLLQRPFSDMSLQSPSTFGCWYFPHSMPDLAAAPVWLSGRTTPDLGFPVEDEPRVLNPCSLVWGMRHVINQGSDFQGGAGFVSAGYTAPLFLEQGQMKTSDEIYYNYTEDMQVLSPDIAGHCWNHAILAYDYTWYEDLDTANDEGSPAYFMAAYNGRLIRAWPEESGDGEYYLGENGPWYSECGGVQAGIEERLAFCGPSLSNPSKPVQDGYFRFGELPVDVDGGEESRTNMMMADSTIDGVHVDIMIPYPSGYNSDYPEWHPYDPEWYREILAEEGYYSGLDAPRTSDIPNCWWGYWQDERPEHHAVTKTPDHIVNTLIPHSFDKGRYQSDGLQNGWMGIYTSPYFDFTSVVDARGSCSFRSVSYAYRRPQYQRTSQDLTYHFQQSNYELNLRADVADPLDGVYHLSGLSALGTVTGNFLDVFMIQDPIGLNLWDEDAGDWVHSDMDREACVIAPTEHRLDIAGMPTQGLRFDSQHPLRFKILFSPCIEPGQPLYEAPSFDDITFTFHIGQPVILAWAVVG